MIKIACCDDDQSILEDCGGMLNRYRMERKCEFEYSGYHSPLELMAAMERGLRWDILLLDIVMPGGNGVELAKEIRTYDEQVKIIFLTSSPEYAVQSYTVGAYFYLLKPLKMEDLFPVLDRATDACMKARSEKLILKCKTGITAVAPDKIEYCEVIRHSLRIHLQNGAILESVGKLDDLEYKLCSVGGFLRVHRSYLVNMAYIQSISYKAVVLNCQAAIPIPHGKYNEVKKIYLDYAFEKERVLI